MYQPTSFRKKLLEISDSRKISFKDIDILWVIQALGIPFTKHGAGSSCSYNILVIFSFLSTLSRPASLLDGQAEVPMVQKHQPKQG